MELPKCGETPPWIRPISSLMLYSFVWLLFKYNWWEVTWWDRSQKPVLTCPRRSCAAACDLHAHWSLLLTILSLSVVKARQELVSDPVTKVLMQKFIPGGLQAQGNWQELLAASEWQLWGFGSLCSTLLCFLASRKQENSPTSAFAVRIIGSSWQCQRVSKLILTPSAFSCEINWYNLFVN